jgi:aspartyl-tRNA(Asn)/glutamyl-tRNA(Gln) amidotransferase subunit A
MSALHELSAGELLAGYRERDFSPREVVDALADRIADLDPALGAFNELCLDRARHEADAGLGGDGPLAGVPFAAKDLFDSEGVRTTYGSRMFAEHVPERDAAAVAALRAAGAILIGKTQTHEFAWGVTSINDAMGSSRNPWDTSRVPGGSSGGSAVALAARMVPLALGSDTGGSVRIPAAFCGVTGLKPTYGRVDARGVWPLAPSLDHVGPMARTPDDLALALGVLDGGGAVPAGAPSLAGTTVAVCPDLHLTSPEPAVEGALRDAVAVLESLGARVEERPLPEAELVAPAFAALQLREALQVHTEAGLYPARADEYGHDVRRRLEHAAAADPRDYVSAVAARELLRAALARLLRDGALLITPVAATGPIRCSDDRSDPGRAFRAAVLPYNTPHDLAGIPSCAVRAGFDDDGMPVGVQIAAAPWHDERVLAAASAFHAATPEIQGRWP